MGWFLMALKKYAVFSGRSRRREFWFFMLFYVIIVFVLAYLDAAIGLTTSERGAGILSTVFVLAMLIPGLALTVRRLHDTGRTGWWVLIGFVPLIGNIVLLVFMCLDSESGANQYGPAPKAA